MNYVHGQHGITARSKSVSLSIFGILILMTLASCNTTETEKGTAPAGLRDLVVTEASTTTDTVELTWSQPTDFGTTDGTTAAIFGSYAVKVYQGADEGGSEVEEGLTLEPASLDESTVSVKVSGLNPLTQYAFKLVLSNGNDSPLSSDSNIVSTTTQDPRGRIWNEVSVKGDWFPVRFRHAAVVFDNKLWIIGGVAGGDFNDVWSSSDGESWTEVAANNKDDATRFSGRYGHAAVVFDNKLWVIGGIAGARLNDVWSSSDGKSWTKEAEETKETEETEETEDVTTTGFSGRQEHAAVVFDGKLWVIGGYDGTNRLNDVWSSSDGKSWTEVVTNDADAARFSVRNSHAAVVFDGKLWVIGGYAEGSTRDTRYNDVWSSPDGKSWTEVVTDDADAARFSMREGHAAVVSDNKLWVIGGYDGTRLNDVWSSSDGKSWTEVTKGVTSTRFSGRNDHAAVVFGGKFWVVGGIDGDVGDVIKNDVWYSP